MTQEADKSLFDLAADESVALGNRVLEEHPDGDAWEIASGLVAGAVHFWLYTHQPCGDAGCEECTGFSTAELRLRRLLEEVRQSATESSYYHTPQDTNAGTA